MQINNFAHLWYLCGSFYMASVSIRLMTDMLSAPAYRKSNILLFVHSVNGVVFSAIFVSQLAGLLNDG